MVQPRCGHVICLVYSSSNSAKLSSTDVMVPPMSMRAMSLCVIVRGLCAGESQPTKLEVSCGRRQTATRHC